MKGFILGVIVTASCFLAWPKLQAKFQSSPPPVKQDDAATLALRDYIARNFADPDAELTTMSEPVEFNGQTWRFVTLRLVNAMGGKVFSSYYVTYEDALPKTFIPDDRYDKLPGSTKEESEAFWKAFKGVKEQDVRRPR